MPCTRNILNSTDAEDFSSEKLRSLLKLGKASRAIPGTYIFLCWKSCPAKLKLTVLRWFLPDGVAS